MKALTLLLLLLGNICAQIEIESWTNLPVKNFCNSIALSEDNELIAYGTNAGYVTVVKLEDGEKIINERIHINKVTAVTFSRDNSIIYSSGEDQNIYAMDIGTKQKTLVGKHARVISMTTSSNGKYLVSNNLSGAKVWKTQSNEQFREFSLNAVRHTAYSPDGKLLALGNKNDIVIKKMPGGMPFRRLKGHASTLHKISFSDDSKWIVSVGWDKRTYIWDVNSESRLAEITNKQNAKFAKISPKKSAVLYADSGGIAFYDVKNKTSKVLEKYPNCIGYVVSRDWKLLVGFSFQQVKLWAINLREKNTISKLTPLVQRKNAQIKFAEYNENIKDIKGNFIKRFQKYKNRSLSRIANLQRPSNSPVFCMRYNNDENMLAVGNYNGKIHVWSLKNKKRIVSLPGHATKAKELCFSNDDKYLVSGGEDNTVRIWNLKSKKEVGRIDLSSTVTSIDISHDGTQLVTSDGGNVKSYNLVTGKFVHNFNENGSINKLRFCYKKNIVACLTAAGTISIYDIDSGSRQHFFKDAKRIQDFEFSLDGKQLVIAYVNQVDIFEVDSWKKTHTFSVGKQIKQVSISPDNDIITIFDLSQRKLLFFSVPLQKKLSIDTPTSTYSNVAVSRKYQYFTHIERQTLDVYSLKGKGRAPIAVKIYDKNAPKNATQKPKKVSFPEPDSNNKQQNAVIIMPLTKNKKRSYLGTYLSLMGMYHATYVPQQILKMSVVKVEQLFYKHNIIHSQKLANDRHVQHIVLNYFQTKNLVTGNIDVKGTNHYVDLYFQGENGKRTFKQKFAKRHLKRLPLWIGSCVHRYLKIKLSATKQSYVKKNPYRHFGDIAKAAKIYRAQSVNRR